MRCQTCGSEMERQGSWGMVCPECGRYLSHQTRRAYQPHPKTHDFLETVGVR